MKTGKQLVNTHKDNIRRWEPWTNSDSAKTEISNKVMDNLRAYHISNQHSEPYHQNQNPAEWRYRTLKAWTNTVMNKSGAPPPAGSYASSMCVTSLTNSLCSFRWKITPFCPNLYYFRYFHHSSFHFLPTCVLCYT